MAVDEAGDGEHLEEGALERGHDLDRDERARVRAEQENRAGYPAELGGENCRSIASQASVSGESRLMVGRLLGHRGAR